MDVNKIRRDFPALNDKGTVYFDTACQSLRPQVVLDAMNEYYQHFPACSGRSMHHMAAKVTQKVEDARVSLAKFLNASKKEEIVFTRNTTEGINLVANTLFFKPGDVILITDKEHNSNLIPWQKLCRQRGTVLKIVPTQPDGTFDLDAYTKLLDPPGQAGFLRAYLQPGRCHHPRRGDHQARASERLTGDARCSPIRPAPPAQCDAPWMSTSSLSPGTS